MRLQTRHLFRSQLTREIAGNPSGLRFTRSCKRKQVCGGQTSSYFEGRLSVNQLNSVFHARASGAFCEQIGALGLCLYPPQESKLVSGKEDESMNEAAQRVAVEQYDNLKRDVMEFLYHGV